MPLGCCRERDSSSRRADSGGLERRRRQDDDLRFRFVALAVLAVEEGDPSHPAGVRVDQHLVRDGVGPEREISGVHRRVDQPGGRVERGVDVAPSRASAAGTPAETLAAVPIVLQPVGGDAGTIGRQDPSRFLEALAQLDLADVEPGGSLKQAVRQMRQVFLDAGDAEIKIHLVVIRSDVLVGDGPVLTVAVVRFGLEVVVGQAERQPAPDVGLAPEAASPDPGVVGSSVGVILLVDQDILDVVRSRPSADVRIHVLERGALGVGRPPDGVLVEREGV